MFVISIVRALEIKTFYFFDTQKKFQCFFRKFLSFFLQILCYLLLNKSRRRQKS
jgi:hypothetical protein